MYDTQEAVLVFSQPSQSQPAEPAEQAQKAPGSGTALDGADGALLQQSQHVRRLHTAYVDLVEKCMQLTENEWPAEQQAGRDILNAFQNYLKRCHQSGLQLRSERILWVSIRLDPTGALVYADALRPDTTVQQLLTELPALLKAMLSPLPAAQPLSLRISDAAFPRGPAPATSAKAAASKPLHPTERLGDIAARDLLGGFDLQLELVADGNPISFEALIKQQQRHVPAHQQQQQQQQRTNQLPPLPDPSLALPASTRAPAATESAHTCAGAAQASATDPRPQSRSRGDPSARLAGGSLPPIAERPPAETSTSPSRLPAATAAHRLRARAHASRSPSPVSAQAGAAACAAAAAPQAQPDTRQMSHGAGHAATGPPQCSFADPIPAPRWPPGAKSRGQQSEARPAAREQPGPAETPLGQASPGGQGGVAARDVLDASGASAGACAAAPSTSPQTPTGGAALSLAQKKLGVVIQRRSVSSAGQAAAPQQRRQQKPRPHEARQAGAVRLNNATLGEARGNGSPRAFNAQAERARKAVKRRRIADPDNDEDGGSASPIESPRERSNAGQAAGGGADAGAHRAGPSGTAGRAAPAAAGGGRGLPGTLARAAAAAAAAPPLTAQRIKWQLPEVMQLVKGVEEYGTQWARIASVYFPDRNCTAFQSKLKDKWRTLCKGSKKRHAARDAIPAHVWNEIETLSKVYGLQ